PLLAHLPSGRSSDLALTADDLRPANEAGGEPGERGELERRVRVLVAEFSALRGALDEALVELAGEPTPAAAFERVRVLLRLLARSEEHTSELQSREN